MRLAVRASKLDAVKLQLQSSLELEEANIVAAPTNYGGITLLNLDESAVSALSSIRNIEALLIDEEAATQLQHPSVASEAHSFKSLNGVDEREQYDHRYLLKQENRTVYSDECCHFNYLGMDIITNSIIQDASYAFEKLL